MRSVARAVARALEEHPDLASGGDEDLDAVLRWLSTVTLGGGSSSVATAEICAALERNLAGLSALLAEVRRLSPSACRNGRTAGEGVDPPGEVLLSSRELQRASTELAERVGEEAEWAGRESGETEKVLAGYTELERDLCTKAVESAERALMKTRERHATEGLSLGAAGSDAKESERMTREVLLPVLKCEDEVTERLVPEVRALGCLNELLRSQLERATSVGLALEAYNAQVIGRQVEVARVAATVEQEIATEHARSSGPSGILTVQENDIMAKELASSVREVLGKRGVVSSEQEVCQGIRAAVQAAEQTRMSARAHIDALRSSYEELAALEQRARALLFRHATSGAGQDASRNQDSFLSTLVPRGYSDLLDEALALLGEVRSALGEVLDRIEAEDSRRSETERLRWAERFTLSSGAPLPDGSNTLFPNSPLDVDANDR